MKKYVKIENVDKNMTTPFTLSLPRYTGPVSRSDVGCRMSVRVFALQKGKRAKKGKRVTVSALRSSRLPPPTSCVQAEFRGFHRFTSTVFDVWLLRGSRGVWLLRGSRGELLFRPSFLCDRLLMHLRLSALYEQGRARASAFSFGEVLFSFVRGS